MTPSVKSFHSCLSSEGMQHDAAEGFTGVVPASEIQAMLSESSSGAPPSDTECVILKTSTTCNVFSICSIAEGHIYAELPVLIRRELDYARPE